MLSLKLPCPYCGAQNEVPDTLHRWREFSPCRHVAVVLAADGGHLEKWPLDICPHEDDPGAMIEEYIRPWLDDNKPPPCLREVPHQVSPEFRATDPPNLDELIDEHPELDGGEIPTGRRISATVLFAANDGAHLLRAIRRAWTKQFWVLVDRAKAELAAQFTAFRGGHASIFVFSSKAKADDYISRMPNPAACDVAEFSVDKFTEKLAMVAGEVSVFVVDHDQPGDSYHYVTEYLQWQRTGGHQDMPSSFK